MCFHLDSNLIKFIPAELKHLNKLGDDKDSFTIATAFEDAGWKEFLKFKANQ